MRVNKTTEHRAWLDGLKDPTGRARILVRVDRLIDGNPGQHRHLTDGVSELKVDLDRATASITHSAAQDYYCSCSAGTSQTSKTTSKQLSS